MICVTVSTHYVTMSLCVYDDRVIVAGTHLGVVMLVVSYNDIQQFLL